ncbi:uncharacterized protein PHALS_09402 [Plasmopara halstedii]|uniref:Uncharacterized protein n=1 Tax=Plasmopara halstedii TaxID=4781 RepID=A0A0N7L398_PLAHL|nr:uncharacterized protein PHALS_09402 [Plasmopara halstedii]CEG35275.1 hypothetical protein PHALS_09402 [Plasmopara halstedii]|eukprot:XP_024571644.1 hypothetical protein PHALS_09402 [Plasmopara halstedii]
MNTSLAVISHAPHRFLSLTKVIKCFLELKHPIDKYYDERLQLSNLMSSLKEELRQLYSLIAPLNTMSAAAPLQVTRPSRDKNGESKEDAFFVEHHMLEKTVRKFRRLMEKAFKKRFLVRYDHELFPETSTKKDKAK